MIAADHNWRFHFSFGDESIEQQSRAMTFAVSKPADARRQSLKFDALLRHANPTMQWRVIREKLENRFVGHEQIVRIARQHRPAERTFSFAEKRTNEKRNEAADFERVLHARFVA